MWSVGCVFAEMLVQVQPFFKGEFESAILSEISWILGTDEVFSYAKKYNINITDEYSKLLGHHYKKNWKSFRNKYNDQNLTDQSIDLVTKMLILD